MIEGSPIFFVFFCALLMLRKFLQIHYKTDQTNKQDKKKDKKQHENRKQQGNQKSDILVILILALEPNLAVNTTAQSQVRA